MRMTVLLSLTVVATALVSGCGQQPSASPRSILPVALGSSESPTPEREGAPAPLRVGTVSVSSEIARLCSLRAVVGSAPRFSFDSDEIGDPERQVLSQVARCFTAGPLKGRALKVTGHADPRGEEEYNMSLAAARATSVKGYLGERGVDMRRIRETSRGELDASGDDEGTWARDRRVDIDLIKSARSTSAK